MEDTLEYLKDEMQLVDVYGQEALRKAGAKQREAIAPLLDTALEAMRDLVNLLDKLI